MDLRKGTSLWLVTIFLAVLLESISPGQAFFFPRFFNRRQVFPAQQQQHPQQQHPSSRGQIGDGVQAPNLRIVNRQNQNPGQFNGNPDGTVPNPSFHVPKALCLACENFPWTPVAGKEGAASAPVGKHSNPPQQQPQQHLDAQQTTNVQSQQQKPAAPQQPQQPPTLHVQQQQTQQQQQNNFQQQAIDIDKYPVHQNLIITKEPGGTVVINALGPDPQPQGDRRPFSFQFDSAQSLNNFQVQGYPSNAVKQIGSAIILPYDPPSSNPTLLKPVTYPTEQPKPTQSYSTFSFAGTTTPIPVQFDVYPQRGQEAQAQQNVVQQQNFDNQNKQKQQEQGYSNQNQQQQFSNQHEQKQQQHFTNQHEQKPQQQHQQPSFESQEQQKQQQSQQQNFIHQDQNKQPQQSQQIFNRPQQGGYGYHGQGPLAPAFISNQPPLFYPRDPRPAPPPTLLIPVKNPNNYHVPQNRPPNSPPLYLVNTNQNQVNHDNRPLPPPRPIHPPQGHHHNIPPITVGTIVAAQHNLQIHDIQPAKLIYQEHSQGYAPPPPPYRPPSGYAPGPDQQHKPHHGSPSAPQSFKLPILSRPNNNVNSNRPFGTFTINQIPVQSVPNHVPHPVPQLSGIHPPNQQGGYPANTQNFPPNNYPPPPQKPQNLYGKPSIPQPSPTPGNYGPPRPFQSNFESQQTQQVHQQVNQPTPNSQESSYGAQIPQRPTPPERPQPPQLPAFGSVPMPHREMRPPPPFAPPSNPTQQQQGLSPVPQPAPQPFPTQSDPVEYNNPIFENDLDTNEAPEDEIRDEGQGEVAFPTPQATLELGPIPNSDDGPPEYSEGRQPKYGPEQEINVEVTPDDSLRNPSLITIPNLLRIQPQQSYNGGEQVQYFQPQPQSPTSFHHQYVVPIGTKSVVTIPEYTQASFNSYVRQRQPENTASEFLFRGPAPAPPQAPIVSTGSVPASSDYSKNPNIQSLEFQKEKEQADAKAPVAVTPRPFEAGPPVGSYEIIPATQYDITHLFTNPPPPTVPVGEVASPSIVQVQAQHQSGFQGRPVPISFNEADAANSKSPVFIVQQADGQISYPKPVIHARPSIVHNVNAPAPSQQFFQYPQFQHQPQYDPLPPSIVSALHHAQRTSFLTHQHHTPAGNGDQEKTIYVNSISVQENPNRQKPGAPYAIDLNSGKPILVHEERDSETQSLKTVLESDAKNQELIPASAQENEALVNYVAQEEQRETAETNTVTKEEAPAPADQTVVNCNNNHQWVIPAEGASEVNSNAQQVLAEEAPTQDGEARKQFVYYYPSPLSSIYWVEQPQGAASNQGSFGQRIRVDNTNPQQQLNNEQPPTPNTFNSEASAHKTIYSKPILKWSKVIESSGQVNNVVHATRLSNSFSPMQIEGDNGDEIAASVSDPISTAVPYDTHSQGNSPQIDEQSLDEAGEPEPEVHSTTAAPSQLKLPEEQQEALESETSAVHQQVFRVSVNGQEVPVSSDQRKTRPKSPKFVDEPTATVAETIGNSNEIVGPTTISECITESTTEYTVPTSLFTDTTDGTTVTVTTPTSTFSPRIKISAAMDKIKLRVGSRFPTGRPSIPAYRTSTVLPDGNQDASPASASIQVPVYRPAISGLVTALREHAQQTSTPAIVFSPPRKNLLTLEDIYKSSEMKQLGQVGAVTESTTTSRPSSTSTTAISHADVEDDEAEESGIRGTTGRKVPSAASSVQYITAFSPQITTTAPTTTEAPIRSSMSTKVVKTVRVRQRMRPGSLGSFLNSNAGNGPLRSRGSGLSRIRVIQRPASQEYFKNFPEYAAPEGESLAEEEQKEVKNALIEIKKI